MADADPGAQTLLTIHARSVSLDGSTEDYVRRKFDRLARHLPSMTAAVLELSLTSSRSADDRVVAQLTISAGGRSLRGQERGATVRQAVDLVADVLDRQIRRYKTRFYRSSSARRSARSVRGDGPTPPPPDGAGEDQDPDGPPEGRVIRTKRFAMSPMSVEDAIEEMEMLSHGFFLFYNAETHSYSVVYRRHDGDYGLLEPQLLD